MRFRCLSCSKHYEQGLFDFAPCPHCGGIARAPEQDPEEAKRKEANNDTGKQSITGRAS